MIAPPPPAAPRHKQPAREVPPPPPAMSEELSPPPQQQQQQPGGTARGKAVPERPATPATMVPAATPLPPHSSSDGKSSGDLVQFITYWLFTTFIIIVALG
ncbi:hypothetical protein ACP4OV_022270 [Aristida adscensionis]